VARHGEVRSVALEVPQFVTGFVTRFCPKTGKDSSVMGEWQNLVGPILAALIGGPLAAFAFRYLRVPSEVGDHDARVVELNEGLRRWVRDRDRQLQRELRTLVNQAGSGIARRFTVPPEERPPPGTGSQLYAGALVNEAVAGMRDALHEYRDEASGKVREYAALARSEGSLHRGYRRRHSREARPLGLPDAGRRIVASWRQREHPSEREKTIAVNDDPTAAEQAIAPLETAVGFSWAAASV
jgi:hypothetical protein